MTRSSFADEVINELLAREARQPCGRCGQASFSCLNKETHLLVNDGSTMPIMSREVVPMAIVYCEHCGAATPHLLGTLGMVGTEDETEPGNV